MFGNDTVDSITSSFTKTIDRLTTLAKKYDDIGKYNHMLAEKYADMSKSNLGESLRAVKIAARISKLLEDE